MARYAAWFVNGSLRLLIAAFAVEALLAGTDPRFTGKGIEVRDLVLAGLAMTIAIPLIHAYRRGSRPYPVWADSLFLSILALDMAANSLNLYEQGWRFDLIPHAYGPAAGTIVLHALGPTWLASAVIVNALHVLLEIQEALGDAIFGTHNVHGWWDTATDLAAGLVACLAVAIAGPRLAARRWLRRERGSRRSPSADWRPVRDAGRG